LAGAAHLELVSGVVRLHPQDAMFEAMLAGWRTQQTARGLREEVIGSRERLVRRFGEFTDEYPWRWQPAHVDEWSAALTSERHMARSTVRAYQGSVRLFTEFLCDSRYGWVAACEREFGVGVHPVPICHEWNTIAHLNDYEGSPEARPFTRPELSCSGSSTTPMSRWTVRCERGARARWPPIGMRRCSRCCTGGGCAAPNRRGWTWPTSGAIRLPRSSAGTGR
jgi:hypothetical protein